MQADRVVFRPIRGVSVLIADLGTGELLAPIPIDSIRYQAVTVGDRVWVTSDGTREALTQIDLQSLEVVEQFQIGMNESDTPGPTQPFIVHDESWVPNRGPGTPNPLIEAEWWVLIGEQASVCAYAS
ncbi:MAG: hypothetical protein ACKVIQ_00505 [Acidimicrobiales bacterium]